MNIANKTNTQQRADVLLSNANPTYSRAALTKLFGMGKISKNGELLKPGDKINPDGVFIADLSPILKPADDIDMPVLYEDENVIVVDKPVGVISHARGRYWDEASVASFIRSKLKGIEGERAGIVHRLDRATSGIMICAKNSESLSYLQKQFNKRTVNKLYKAIVSGTLDLTKGIVDIPLGRNPKKPNQFIVSKEGKAAQTEYYLLSSNDKYSLLSLHPLTGRTHQLRLHMQFLGHPIVGDVLYGGEMADRLFLHAYSLEITIPGGHRKTFKSDLPNEFLKYI